MVRPASLATLAGQGLAEPPYSMQKALARKFEEFRYCFQHDEIFRDQVSNFCQIAELMRGVGDLLVLSARALTVKIGADTDPGDVTCQRVW